MNTPAIIPCIIVCVLVYVWIEYRKQKTVFFLFQDIVISEHTDYIEKLEFGFSKIYLYKKCEDILEGRKSPQSLIHRLKRAETIYLVYDPETKHAQQIMQLHNILLQHTDSITADFVIVTPEAKFQDSTVRLMYQNLNASLERLENFVYKVERDEFL